MLCRAVANDRKPKMSQNLQVPRYKDNDTTATTQDNAVKKPLNMLRHCSSPHNFNYTKIISQQWGFLPFGF